MQRHFEQNLHVPHRSANYGVGGESRVSFGEATTELLVERIVAGMQQAPEYRPVETGGPQRAARLIAELL